MAVTSRWLTRCNTALHVLERGEATDEPTKPSRRTDNACVDQLEYQGEAMLQNPRTPASPRGGGVSHAGSANGEPGAGAKYRLGDFAGNHKASGLSATIIKRMLTSQQLPPPARKIILEYVEEKLAALMGTTNRSFAGFVSGSARTVSGPRAFLRKPPMSEMVVFRGAERRPVLRWW